MLAALAGLVAPFLPNMTLGTIVGAAAGTLAILAVALLVLGTRHRLQRSGMRAALAACGGAEARPTILTDGRGTVLWENRSGSEGLFARLAEALADPEEVIEQLRRGALTKGVASRQISAATDTRLSVRRVDGSNLLWQIEVPIEREVSALLERNSTLDFDALPVPLIEIEEGGIVSVANSAARQLLQIDEEERVELYRLVEGLGRPISDWVDDAFDGRTIQKPEVVRAVRPAEDRFVQITLDTIARPGGTRLMGVMNDATELKTLEAQFVQSQKMEAIGQLAGGVAHDFNNLLTAITGHCDLLLLRHDPGDPDFSDLDQINQNANRAAGLVRQLLAYSRKQNLRPEQIDLRASLSELTHLLDRLVGERVTLSFHHRQDLKKVRADRQQFEQVIMNLVVNARDAMPGGGEIRIETDMEKLAAPLSRNRVEVPAGNYVVVRVIDQGTGIPPDRIDKIFEPFYTTKRPGEGTGLGLSTAYGIVKQSGGYIFADSTTGAGTTFLLYFPALDHTETDEVEAEMEVAPQPEAKPGVVLLVEDESSVRAFAAQALSLKGYTVIEAEDAERALDILQDESLIVDIFLTDVIMPGRDGLSWVLEALEARPETAVIFMSGYAEESFSQQHARLPDASFLPKPFSLAELISMVASKMSRD